MRVASLCILVSAAGALPLSAQTDFYNTSRGRPLRVEDAYPVERFAAELAFAPLRLEHADTGPLEVLLQPMLAYGILPRTELELGAGFGILDDGLGAHRRGVAGVEVGVLHTLTSETRAHPAVALAGELLLPVGSLAPDATFVTVSAIGTRTTRWGRVHLNTGYTLGPDDAPAAHLPRWSAGFAVDRTWPLRSLLAAAEVTVEEPVGAGDLVWHAGTGVRWQWTPRVVVDGGVGRRFGSAGAWSFTLGLAYAFGVRGLIPVAR